MSRSYSHLGHSDIACLGVLTSVLFCILVGALFFAFTSYYEDYEVDNNLFVPHGHLSDKEMQVEDDIMDNHSPETQKAKLKIIQQQLTVAIPGSHRTTDENVCHQIEVNPSVAPSRRYRTKFFLFVENCRSPYRETWGNSSTKIQPRRSFVEDTKFFDYEVDSDDEWEEEEPGESLHGCNDEKDVDPEEDYEVDNILYTLSPGYPSQVLLLQVRLKSFVLSHTSGQKWIYSYPMSRSTFVPRCVKEHTVLVSLCKSNARDE